MSASWTHLLGGWVIAIGIAISLAVTASALTRVWFGSDSTATRSERLTDWLVGYVAVAIALVQALGFAGLFRLGPVLVCAGLLGGLGVIGGGRRTLRARWADLTGCVHGLLRSPPLLAASLLGLAVWMRALSVRDITWDGLVYHLTYPAVWILHAGFVPFDAPGIWEQYESFPKGTEALYALAMLPLSADDLTYFVHVPLWFGTGCALYATARRIGCSQRLAQLAAACAMTSPALAMFLGPGNIEIPVAFAIVAATSAGTRAIVAREPSALAACLLALGLGAALKVTSLAYLPFGVVAVLACMRTPFETKRVQPQLAHQGPPGLEPAYADPARTTTQMPTDPNSREHADVRTRECLRHTIWGAALGAAVAAPWYVNNLMQCSNPLYPAALPGASEGPAAGTLANAWIVRESSVVAQRVFSDVLESLATAPWKAAYQGPGWLYLFAMLANTVAGVLLWFLAQRITPEASSATSPASSSNANVPSMLIAAATFTALAWALTVLYLVMPWNGVFWAANARFLTPALLFGLVGLAAATTVLPRWVSSATWTIAIAIAAASWVQPRYWQSLHVSAPLDAARSVVHAREHTLATTTRDRFPADSAIARLWRQVDALPPSRIAYAVGGVDAQEGWLFYPLFGSSLQHDVRYVDVERDATPACQRRGMIRDALDEHAWLERLASEQIDWIVTSGKPQEARWVTSHPEQFRLALTADEYSLYERTPR